MATITKGRVKFDTENVFGYVKGTTKWAQILEVDDYGKYSVNMYGDDVVELKEELEALRGEAAKEVEELGKKYELADVLKTDDVGEEFISFKLPPENYEGKEQKITMLDAGGNVVEYWDKLVGNGSNVKIKYMFSPYYMSSSKMVGISYKIYAMQVINLVEYKASDSGFGDETVSDVPFEVETKKDGEDF